ncbi:MAG: radical SAM protein [bacterium]
MTRSSDYLTETEKNGREKVAVIEVGAGCNNSCSFCPMEGRKFEFDPEAIEEQIRREAAGGANAVVFTGREPTILPGIIQLAKAARDSGFRRIRLETNGRMFAYEKFTAAAIASGFSEIAVRLSAPNSETALKINPVQSAFAQTVQGIRNLARAAASGVHISVSIPVVPENATLLGEIVLLTKELEVQHITFQIMPGAGSAEIEERVGNAVQDAGRLGLFVEVRDGDKSFAPDPKDRRISKEDDEFRVDTYCEVGSPPRRELFSRDLRVVYRCNQSCIFCGVERVAAPDPHEMTLAAIKDAAGDRLPRLNLSGGEPTLSPHLAEYVALAKEAGVWEVTLMTNAVLLTRAGRCAELKRAGLDKVFVSLHAPSAELSDSITNSPGGFEKTVEGVHNLIAAGIHTGLIFVLCSANAAALPDYVRFVSETFGSLPVFCSYATPYFDTSLPVDIVPAYREAVPYIRDAFHIAREFDVPISFMEEQHGIPECILPDRDKYFRNLFAPISKGAASGFIKSEECAECDENAACPGVRKYYALLRGMGEVVPIKRHGRK